MIYCDTSFLLSLYIADSWSDIADRWVREKAQPVVWTPWHELEFTTALEARVGRGDTERDVANAVFRSLIEHQASGFLLKQPVRSWSEVTTRACQVARAHGAHCLSRSFDVLHVALCLELELKLFLSFDRRQVKLAKRLGLEAPDLM